MEGKVIWSTPQKLHENKHKTGYEAGHVKNWRKTVFSRSLWALFLIRRNHYGPSTSEHLEREECDIDKW